MKINYGIAAVDPSDGNTILHFCGYEELPEQSDFEALEAELRRDEEFGLTDVSFELKLVSDEVLPKLLESMGLCKNTSL